MVNDVAKEVASYLIDGSPLIVLILNKPKFDASVVYYPSCKYLTVILDKPGPQISHGRVLEEQAA